MDASGLQGTIEQLLDEPYYLTLTPLPPALQSAYASRRAGEFARLINTLWALPALLYLGAIAFTWVLYHRSLIGPDLRIFLWADAIIGVTLALGLRLALLPDWQQAYTRWLPLPLGLVLLCKTTTGLLFASPALARNDMLLMLVIMVVATQATRLPLDRMLLACLIGAAGFLLLPWAASTSFGWTFMASYAAAMVIFMALAAIQENRSRQMFLHAMLLQISGEHILRLNDELELLARRDSLSGLANRLHFDEALAREWERARREQTSLALLMLDVDHFKLFNDRYGHPAGDDCLRRVGAVLAGLIRRPGDLAARYGGEEFAILLPKTDLRGAAELAEQLVAGIDALRIPHPAATAWPHVSISVGLSACLPSPLLTAQQLVDTADAALYDAKHRGRRQAASRDLMVAPDTGNTGRLSLI